MLHRALSLASSLTAQSIRVPKSLFAPFEHLHHAARLASTAGAHRRKPFTRVRQKSRPGPLVSQADEDALVNRFRAGIDSEDLRSIHGLYAQVKPLLKRWDTRRLAESIHRLSRNADPENSAWLVAFADEVVRDIGQRELLGHHFAFVHLLSLYKDAGEFDKATQLWEWLLHQDDELLGPTVYGAAIEMLCARGESLESLEQLYEQALQRYPGSFSEYHLSPNAILRNRSEEVTAPGLSMTLLQGICAARVHYGDMRNAYLALDTALRLHPTDLPLRFFDMFIKTRPTAEAYTVYQIACRSGIRQKHACLDFLLVLLKPQTSGNQRAEKYTSQLNSSASVQFQLDAIHALIGTGDSVNVLTFRHLVTSLFYLLPKKGPSPQRISPNLVACFDRVTSAMERSGLRPYASIIRTLVSAAGRLESPELFARVIRLSHGYSDFAKDDVYQRILLTTVGQLKYEDTFKEIWQAHVSKQRDVDGNPSRIAWITFANAAKHADMIPYLAENFSKHRHEMDSELQDQIAYRISDTARATMQGPSTQSEESSYPPEKVEAILQQISSMCDLIESPKPLDLKTSPFQMSLSRPRLPASNEDLRKVYDKLTTDPQAPESTEPQQNKVLATGFSIEELRFENWKSMNELLAEAELEQPARIERLDPKSPTPKDALSGEDLERAILRLRTPQAPLLLVREESDTLEILDA